MRPSRVSTVRVFSGFKIIAFKPLFGSLDWIKTSHHVTTFFIGDVSEAEIPTLLDIMRALPSNESYTFTAWKAVLGKTKVFVLGDEHDAPDMLKLRDFRVRLSIQLSRAHFTYDTREWVPHTSIAPYTYDPLLDLWNREQDVMVMIQGHCLFNSTRDYGFREYTLDGSINEEASL